MEVAEAIPAVELHVGCDPSELSANPEPTSSIPGSSGITCLFRYSMIEFFDDGFYFHDKSFLFEQWLAAGPVMGVS